MNLEDLQKLNDEDLIGLAHAVKHERHRRARLNKARKDTQRGGTAPAPGGRVRYWQIYVLVLEHHKWYVGVTAQKVEARYAQHASGVGGSKWTRLHKPKGIVESYSIGQMTESEALVHETAKTLELADQYGIDNVRGGKLTVLDEARVARTYKRLLRIRDMDRRARGVAL